MPWHGTRHYCGCCCCLCCYWCLNCDRCLQRNCIQSYWDTSHFPTTETTCLATSRRAKYIYFIETLRHFTKHWTDLLFSHFCSLPHHSLPTSNRTRLYMYVICIYICVYFISLFSSTHHFGCADFFLLFSIRFPRRSQTAMDASNKYQFYILFWRFFSLSQRFTSDCDFPCYSLFLLIYITTLGNSVIFTTHEPRFVHL